MPATESLQIGVSVRLIATDLSRGWLAPMPQLEKARAQ